jgi:hypothetical protein
MTVKTEPVEAHSKHSPAPGSGVLIGKKRSSTPTKAHPRTPPPVAPKCKLEPPDENEEDEENEWEEEEEEDDDDEVVMVEADKTVDLTDVACDVCGTVGEISCLYLSIFLYTMLKSCAASCRTSRWTTMPSWRATAATCPSTRAATASPKYPMATGSVHCTSSR